MSPSHRHHQVNTIMLNVMGKHNQSAQCLTVGMRVNRKPIWVGAMRGATDAVRHKKGLHLLAEVILYKCAG